MKVFVSVGTHPQPFDRLLKEIDRVAGRGKARVQLFAQTGNSRYKPKHFASQALLDSKDFEGKISWSDVVVSHGGAGTIITVLRHKKPLLLVPRLRKFGEHTNDHQLDLAKALETEGKAKAVFETRELEKALLEMKSFKPDLHSDRKRLVARIEGFLGELK